MNIIKMQIRTLLRRNQRIFIIKIIGIWVSYIIHIIDLVFLPTTILFAFYFRLMRKRKFHSLPFSKSVLFKIGVYPIIDHYYEPMFNPKYLRKSLRENRILPGIDLNIQEQLKTLNKFNYNDELSRIPIIKDDNSLEFCHDIIGIFPPADAEYLYNIIRYFKPRNIIEIGSGQSTLMATNAVKKNELENENYSCEHVCIEPYEIEWLEKLNVKVIRELVENTDTTVFSTLDKNDILFIDSSHIIRPQGDVLFEYLEILPILKSGVLVHIHDIFTPEDYPDDWVNNASFWNEQYLLEAFLSFNNEFRVIGATNFLMHNYYGQISSKCPITKMLTEKGEVVGAGSFWMVKN